MTMTEYDELMNDTRLFYWLPKRLFEDPAFEEMSIDAKMHKSHHLFDGKIDKHAPVIISPIASIDF